MPSRYADPEALLESLGLETKAVSGRDGQTWSVGPRLGAPREGDTFESREAALDWAARHPHACGRIAVGEPVSAPLWLYERLREAADLHGEDREAFMTQVDLHVLSFFAEMTSRGEHEAVETLEDVLDLRDASPDEVASTFAERFGLSPPTVRP